MTYQVKLLRGSPIICGGAMAFEFDLNPLLLLFYDLIFLLIFAAYPTTPKLRGRKQPFYFAMILEAMLLWSLVGWRHLKAQLCGLVRWATYMALGDDHFHLGALQDCVWAFQCGWFRVIGPFPQWLASSLGYLPQGARLKMHNLLWPNPRDLHIVPVLLSVGCV